MNLLMVTVAVVLALAALTVALALVGARRWSAQTDGLLQQIEPADASPLPTVQGPCHDRHELDGLPAPVQRYFRLVLPERQPIIATTTLAVSGTFNLSATGQRWRPFTSTQRVATQRPGFVWDARIAMLPGLPVHVVDGYVQGQGVLHAALLGLVTVAELRGGGEIARGELMRWLAEAAWYPTALLPSQGVRWQAVDEHSADATVVDGALSLTMRFHFDAAGHIVSAWSAGRGAVSGRGAARTTVMMPWEGRWADYQRRNGLLLPMQGEAAWLPPGGARRPYFVGRVDRIAHTFRV
jgi:hypothetical protein